MFELLGRFGRPPGRPQSPFDLIEGTLEGILQLPGRLLGLDQGVQTGQLTGRQLDS